MLILDIEGNWTFLAKLWTGWSLTCLLDEFYQAQLPTGWLLS